MLRFLEKALAKSIKQKSTPVPSAIWWGGYSKQTSEICWVGHPSVLAKVKLTSPVTVINNIPKRYEKLKLNTDIHRNKIPCSWKNIVFVAPIVHKLHQRPVRMIKNEAAVLKVSTPWLVKPKLPLAVKVNHHFHQVKFTLQDLIYTIWKFLWVGVGKLGFH